MERESAVQKDKKTRQRQRQTGTETETDREHYKNHSKRIKESDKRVNISLPIYTVKNNNKIISSKIGSSTTAHTLIYM